MFISKIRIENLRCFEDTTIEFNEGLNVTIGENNSGKTTIFKALQLIFNRSHSGHFTVDDFYNGIKIDEEKPPEISVTVTIESSANELPEDKAVVASWLTKLEAPWQATLTYKYFLPEKDKKDYVENIKSLNRKAEPGKEEYWEILSEFLPKYVSRIYGGNVDSKNRAEPEYLDKFDCEVLEAIRDVESKMFTGQNVLLKDVLNHFLDHELKRPVDEGKSEESKKDEILKIKKDFKENADKLISGMKKRIYTKDILELAKQTGADIGGEPAIGGELEVRDVISALKLIIKNENREVPIINNGLGYNNLIYISLILSKLKMVTDDRYGDNAKIFPFLLIEEPEAHLHPAMQYNFLKFLTKEIKNETKDNKISRQIFITSHSTHITSAVSLDSIICMLPNQENIIEAKYPGRVFSDSIEDKKSKKYIERYLDATKSNMLFSKGVIFVEGLAEQLLLPCLAEYADCPLEEKHVATVRVDGLTFKHFIKLFCAGIQEDRKKFALSKRVSCIIDSDPKRKEKNGKKTRFKACWPFELNIDKNKYEYQEYSTTISGLEEVSRDVDNVEIFSNKSGKRKTFEYDLAWENEGTKFWFPDDFKLSDGDDELNEVLKESFYNEEEKRRARLAASYLLFISKGENAFDLEKKLRDNFDKKPEERKRFVLPDHIKNAIFWACGKEKVIGGNNGAES
jgi:putative ATP-dependent endonuclease of OLD family